MNKARIAVLAVAVAAGGAAAWLASGSPPPADAPAPVIQAGPVIQAAPLIQTEEVLVAGKELPMGTVIAPEGDAVWQAWPKSSSQAPELIRKSDSPKVLEEIAGSVTRSAFLQGEPLRREKLVKGPNSGYLSAILPSGFRAVSIATDPGGGSTAGGFILPNDRVDVIRVFRDEDASKSRGVDVFGSETVLTNIRVLAIAENIQEKKDGERFVKGQNATLELDPRQAEAVIVAQRVSGGTLTLALRSMLDANKPPEALAKDGAVSIVRFGVQSNYAGR